MEAFNLKGAIEYNMKSYKAAQEALADAPPRTEEELDPVSVVESQKLHLSPLISFAIALRLLPPTQQGIYFWTASQVAVSSAVSCLSGSGFTDVTIPTIPL